jgi:hypothetical protein
VAPGEQVGERPSRRAQGRGVAQVPGVAEAPGGGFVLVRWSPALGIECLVEERERERERREEEEGVEFCVSTLLKRKAKKK